MRGTRVRLHATADAILAPHRYPPALARVLVELAGATALLAAALGSTVGSPCNSPAMGRCA